MYIKHINTSGNNSWAAQCPYSAISSSKVMYSTSSASSPFNWAWNNNIKSTSIVFNHNQHTRTTVQITTVFTHTSTITSNRQSYGQHMHQTSTENKCESQDVNARRPAIRARTITYSQHTEPSDQVWKSGRDKACAGPDVHLHSWRA